MYTLKKYTLFLFAVFYLANPSILFAHEMEEKVFSDIFSPLENNNQEYVVLLHGIANKNSYMNKIARAFQSKGYTVINIDYPSRKATLKELADAIYREIEKQLPKDKKVNFVSYSMGGLLVRVILHEHTFQNLGRVVQLAPPNHGSEVSDFFQDYWYYKKMFGPVGQELTTNQEPIQHLFGDIYYELGIIAGNSTLAPFSSFFLLPDDDDGRVSIESTKLNGMKEHIILDVTHTFFARNDDVIKQTLAFIETGSFIKEE